jgi:hypothetical protein
MKYHKFVFLWILCTYVVHHFFQRLLPTNEIASIKKLLFLKLYRQANFVTYLLKGINLYLMKYLNEQ